MGAFKSSRLRADRLGACWTEGDIGGKACRTRKKSSLIAVPGVPSGARARLLGLYIRRGGWQHARLDVLSPRL